MLKILLTYLSCVSQNICLLMIHRIVLQNFLGCFYTFAFPYNGENPFAKFLKTLSDIQREFSPETSPIRTALVTARCAPAHERVIRTLRAWNVRIDEAFFLGGITKRDVLKAFGAHIFFDDQAVHTATAAEVVPAARVPYRQKESMPSERGRDP